MTNPLAGTLLSILMIAAFALFAGGLYLALKRRETKRGLLMVAAAAVLLANVLVWTL